MGGVAPGGSAVDGGQGRLLSHGTNARLFTTTFPTGRPQQDEEQDKHEGRIALALKMDRVQRVLGFDGRSTIPRENWTLLSESVPLVRVVHLRGKAIPSIKPMGELGSTEVLSRYISQHHIAFSSNIQGPVGPQLGDSLRLVLVGTLEGCDIIAASVQLPTSDSPTALSFPARTTG